MDYRHLDQIPDTFYERTKSLYEKGAMDTFSQPHAFTCDGADYTISVSVRDLGYLTNKLTYTGPENAGELQIFYESSKLVEEALRKYPNDDPNLEWNDAYPREPGFVIPWEHVDFPVDAISYGFSNDSIETKPLSAEEYKKEIYVILEMIRRMLEDDGTQQKLIGYLKDNKGVVKSATIFTYPYVNRIREISKLYLTVKKNNVLVLSWKLANRDLDCLTYHESDDDLAIRTDLFG